MAATILKTNAGPCDKIPHCARYEDLAGACLTRNSCSGVDGDATDLLADDLTLA